LQNDGTQNPARNVDRPQLFSLMANRPSALLTSGPTTLPCVHRDLLTGCRHCL
jgi:hypothetical protein